MAKLYAVYQPGVSLYLPLVIKRDFGAACEFARAYYMALHPDQPFTEQVVKGIHFGIGEPDLLPGQTYTLTVNRRNVEGIDLSNPVLLVQHGHSADKFATFIFRDVGQADEVIESYPDLRCSTYMVDFIEHEQMLLQQARLSLVK